MHKNLDFFEHRRKHANMVNKSFGRIREKTIVHQILTTYSLQTKKHDR